MIVQSTSTLCIYKLLLTLTSKSCDYRNTDQHNHQKCDHPNLLQAVVECIPFSHYKSDANVTCMYTYYTACCHYEWYMCALSVHYTDVNLSPLCIDLTHPSAEITEKYTHAIVYTDT